MPKEILVYDSGDPTAGRYTIIYLNQPRDKGRYGGLALSDEPFSFGGIFVDIVVEPSNRLGRQIAFEDLSEDCQTAALEDWSPDEQNND